MKSIRRFLVIVLVAIVTLANFAAAVRGYLGSMDEAERLFNQRLLQQVDLLNYALPLQAITGNTNRVIEFPARASDVESSLEFQWVNNDGTLLARSAAMPDTVLVSLEEGFRYFNFNNYRWHLLVTASSDKQSWYIVAERDDQRYRLAESMILQAVYPMVLALPLIALIIWWVAGVGLRPVAKLARELRQREATDLHPLEQRDMPVELLQLAQSANELLRRLDASFAREKRFSGDAAHELRTPLAALKIHCENLARELHPAPESVMKLQLGIERMSYLVEQILLLNRTAPDHFMGRFEPVNLTFLAKQTVVDCSAALAQKNHQIEFNGDECWVLGDRAALASLLNNLLGNAIKYTPADGVIVVNSWLRGKDVVLEVMDNGPGIPAEQQARVFDRFYRVGGDRHNSQTPGCGLGLSIVQQVVELHNAQIALTQSRFDHGLLAIVTFAAIAAPVMIKKIEHGASRDNHNEKNN
ncbi:ATP-binding protein [Cellvibrio sp. QJXJ]|uniref:ATP-binding protein n=1 Tax=Cellvibrio sp. QJXJ TaxID=2964606 RepID=UPI0021C48F14|nr:ATP-binding protein [Cellvibrio sp. QJXJ]UUA70857.1 ATP-binding protein [Cellvibrio sp. QJXJ]